MRPLRKGASVTFIHCGTLIDEVSDEPRQNVLVEIAGGKFRAITNYSPGLCQAAGRGFHRPGVEKPVCPVWWIRTRISFCKVTRSRDSTTSRF